MSRKSAAQNRRSELIQAGNKGLGLLGAVFLFSVFVNLLMLTGPLFMLQVYDRVLGSRSDESPVALFLLVAALDGLMALLDYARGRVLARFGAQFQEHLDDRVLRLSLHYALSARARAMPASGMRDLETTQGFLHLAGHPAPGSGLDATGARADPVPARADHAQGRSKCSGRYRRPAIGIRTPSRADQRLGSAKAATGHGTQRNRDHDPARPAEQRGRTDRTAPCNKEIPSRHEIRAPVSGVSFYRAELVPNPGGLVKLGDQDLLPGMPVEAFIRTRDRSPLSYLSKPLTDYFERAFRDG